MRPNVLIVDDDLAFLRLIEKDLEGFSESFNVLTAGSGLEALALLKQNYISFIASDLRMPGMDGFELLSVMLKKFPDVPVYVMTSYDKPKTREVVMKSGAAGYLKKPFTAIELFSEITKTLNKKAEGGNLHNVTLETFLQLIEMEQQTSTLRIVDKKGKRGGVLFFKNGELMNARFGEQMGKEAAYEILSWSNVSLAIERGCVFQEKFIQEDLQAILLDAMRVKDEQEEDFDKEEDAVAPVKKEILLDSPLDGLESMAPSATEKSVPTMQDIQPPKPKTVAKIKPMEKQAEAQDLTPIEAIRRKITKSVGPRSGVLDISHDNGWDGLIDQASVIGDHFNCGRLNVLYVNRGEDQFIVVPGDETIAIAIASDAPWDRILNILG